MDHTLRIYNTATGIKELFTPIHQGTVGMYVCGPTVYSHVHIGNVRTFMSFDVIYRYFLHLGYKVRYVRNITDAGHLTDDDNDDNDRFVKQSRLEKLEPMEVVQKYTVDFHKVLSKFNFLPPSIEPTATGHIIEQIELIENFLIKGFAYQSHNSVYFDVFEYNKRGLNYGELSNRNIDQLFTNTRDLDGQNEKKNPQDFALWKKATPSHIMQWNSPWGLGFPGWHLECTSMSMKYLGNKFDIHGGGIDLKFPHHDCEIAQGKANTGENPANIWIHTNMLTMNGLRMSKSTGNYILPLELINGKNDFFEKSFEPSVIRFCFLQAHYRSELDISNNAMMAAEKGFKKLIEATENLKNLAQFKISNKSTLDIINWKTMCYDALNDDFNTPMLIAHLFEGVRFVNILKDNVESISKEDLDLLATTMHNIIFDVLGLESSNLISKNNDNLENVLKILINLRNQARENKDFVLSDQIRNELLKVNIHLNDGKNVTEYHFK